MGLSTNDRLIGSIAERVRGLSPRRSLASARGPLAFTLGTMLREFVDERGRRWTVWDVYSTLLNRDETNNRQSTAVPEEHPSTEPRGELSQSMALNWLAFEAHDGERRRLFPIPTFEQPWSDASEQQLCTWCGMAKQIPPTRRLIE